MPFGENVGSAYVRLYADGDEVPANIKEALDELDPVMKEAGERHSEAYHDGFDKQSEKDSKDTRERLYKGLQEGLGRMHAIGEQLGTDFFDGLQLQLSEELDNSDLGKLLRDKLEDDFALTGSFDRLEASLKDINREAIRGQMELDAFEDEVRDVIRRTDELADSTEHWRLNLDDTWKAVRDLDSEIADGTEHMGDWLDHVRHLEVESRTWTDGFRQHLHNLNVELDHSATLTGKIFGKGSRNDFLNLIGSAVEGLTRIVYAAPNLLEKLLGGGEGGGGGGAANVIKAVSGSLIGLGIAVGILVSFLGPIAALVSGLSAAVIGLVGSLVFAAGAAGGVALALGGPLIAGIGVAVLAITNLDKQADAAFQRILDNFNELGVVAGEAIGPGLKAAAEQSAPALKELEPLVRGISEALGDVAAGWAEALGSPEFGRFRDAAERFFPDAIRQMGEITENVIGGVGGVARAAFPITRDFLDFLTDKTQEFSDWANSIAGQHALRDFFEDAADSARSVGDFIAEAAEATAQLLGMGRESGDTLFDDMADSLQEFTEYLKDNPEAVHDFFANGIQVARDLGNLILGLGEFIDDLDNPQTREQLHDMFEIITWIVEKMGLFIQVTQGSWEAVKMLGSAIGDVAEAIAWAAEETAEFVHSLVTGPKKATDALVDWVAGIPGWFSGLGRKITNSTGDVDWNSIIHNPIPRVNAWFSGLGGRLTRAMGDIDWSKIVPNPVSRIVGWFDGVAGKVTKAIGDVYWSDIIHNPVDDIIGWFSGLGSKISSAIGSISIDIDIPDPTPGFDIPGVPFAARGMLLNGPRLVVAGEAGREAIVPLDRPLHMVDPSVRALSAYAQGIGSVTPGNSGGVVVEKGAVQVFEVGDAEATATATLNKLVARIA